MAAGLVEVDPHLAFIVLVYEYTARRAVGEAWYRNYRTQIWTFLFFFGITYSFLNAGRASQQLRKEC